jgi:molybdate transport system substrate-binding protein
LAAGGFASTPVEYALGRLAIWSKSGPAVLRKAHFIAIANPVHAPYGLAAKQYLERSGLWPEVRDRIVYAENVRQTVQFAETGNADATLTAWSLVKDRGGKLVDARWHDPIRQVAVIPKRARNPEMARRFLAWLTGISGRRVLSAHGFALP